MSDGNGSFWGVVRDIFNTNKIDLTFDKSESELEFKVTNKESKTANSISVSNGRTKVTLGEQTEKMIDAESTE